jgi:hypothetical protein
MSRKFTAVLCAVALILITRYGRNAEQVQDKKYVRTISVSNSGTVISFYDEDTEPLFLNVSEPSEIKYNAEQKLGKTLFTGHTELIIMGTDGDYTDFLTYMLNEWRVPPSCMAVYSDDSDGIDTELLINSIMRKVKYGESPECDIVTVLSELLNPDN